MERRYYSDIVNGGQFHSQGIGEHNSVETGQPDNGALACGAAHFWNPMRNGTTKELVNNFLGRLATQSGNLNIDGHGDIGQIATGGGQDPSWDPDKDQLVADWNIAGWAQEISPLKNKAFTILTIYSCDTGANQGGADLLFQMANILNRPVRARTDEVTCGVGGILYTGGTWQVAYPGPKPPTVIPKTGAVILAEKIRSETCYVTPYSLSFRKKDVLKVTIQRSMQGSRATILFGKPAIDFVEMLMAYPEVDIGGQPLALLTGSVTIDLVIQDRESTIGFNIYNDRIVMSGSSTVARFVSDSLIRSIH
jgi:hypothetical protein